MSKKFEDFAKLDWYNIQQALGFMQEYPEIGWHGKSREQISPSWPRAFKDIEYLKNNIDELYEICTKAKAESKFFGRGKIKKEQ